MRGFSHVASAPDGSATRQRDRGGSDDGHGALGSADSASSIAKSVSSVNWSVNQDISAVPRLRKSTIVRACRSASDEGDASLSSSGAGSAGHRQN